MSETSERDLTFVQILAIIGLGAASTVFLGALFIGMSIDPRVDMTRRLIAYTTALGGLTVAFACHWSLLRASPQRKFFAGITLVTLAVTLVYGAIHLRGHL